jgi:hypothetical protein
VSTDEARNQIQQVLDKYLRSVNAADVTLASNFLQKGFLERDLRPSHIRIRVNGNSAWTTFDWSFTSKLANGQPFTSKGRETHVYEKTSGGWRITHLHYSGLPPPSS